MSSDPRSDIQPGSDEELKWPIGFIVIVTLATLYVVLRLVQMAGWAIDWLF